MTESIQENKIKVLAARMIFMKCGNQFHFWTNMVVTQMDVKGRASTRGSGGNGSHVFHFQLKIRIAVPVIELGSKRHAEATVGDVTAEVSLVEPDRSCRRDPFEDSSMVR